MIVVSDHNENSIKNQVIVDATPELHWYTLMGRWCCGCGWDAMKDWPDGGGYSDYTPWLIFKNHVKEKHGIDVKVHELLRNKKK